MKVQSANGQRSATSPWYTHRWPWLLMLGPATVIVAGAHTAWLAYSRQDALVVDDYYKEGKAINQDLRRDRVAAAKRLRAELRYDAVGGRLIGKLSSLGQPYGGKIFINLVHSTLPEKDVRLQAQADANGDFSVSLPMLDMANWQVLVEGEQRDWRLNGEWTWPQQSRTVLAAQGAAG